MLIVFGVLLFVIGAVFFLITPLLWAGARAVQLADPRTIICPETRRWATVTVDGIRAARAELAGRTEFHLVACSRWPERKDCDQGCAPQVPLVGDDRRHHAVRPLCAPPAISAG